MTDNSATPHDMDPATGICRRCRCGGGPPPAGDCKPVPRSSDAGTLELLGADHGISELQTIELAQLRRVLRLTDGNRTRSAELLGIDRRTLHRKLKGL